MNDDELFERVRRAVAEAWGVALAEVTRETRLLPDGEGDSLDIVEMVMTFEELNLLAISDEAAKGLTMERLRGWTVGDLVEYLRDHLG